MIRLRSLRWVATFLILVPLGIGACERACAQPHASSLPDPIPFKSTIIDEEPPGTDSDCCTDVGALGDLNGDGRQDVVIGAQPRKGVGLVWYSFPDWTRYEIGMGRYTTDGAVADLDGDGDQDIVVSEYRQNRIEWWENGGVPASTENWTRHVLGAGYAHDLAVADMNGDGRPDVIKKKKGESGGWFEAPSDPAGAWPFHGVEGMVGEGLAAADLDADGDVDLVGSHFWFENIRGTGRTWAKHVITEAWGEDCRVAIADVNRDGHVDVVLSHSEGPGRVAWFEHPGTFPGPWREHVVSRGTLVGAHSLAAADFDGDGDTDIFVGEMHTSPSKRVLLYENRGTETWQLQLLSDRGTHNAQVADVDGDGDPDVVGKNYAGPDRAVRFWENLSTDAASPDD